MLSSEEIKETQLNYLIVRKFKGYEYKKKRVKNPIAHIYLSVDFFYSIYIEKVDKTGKLEHNLKMTFPAETSTLKVKNIEKVIEITYIEKGILWDSKKKVQIQLSGDCMDEFILHHQQAKIMFKNRNQTNDPKNKKNKEIHQSSIQLKGKYQDSTEKIKDVQNSTNHEIRNQKSDNTIENRIQKNSENINNESNKIENVHSNENSETYNDYEEYYDEGLDEIEKNYTSEKFIHIDKFNGFINHKKQLDEDLIEEFERDDMVFKKKIENIEEVEEDSFEHESGSSNRSR